MHEKAIRKKNGKECKGAWTWTQDDRMKKGPWKKRTSQPEEEKVNTFPIQFFYKKKRHNFFST